MRTPYSRGIVQVARLLILESWHGCWRNGRVIGMGGGRTGIRCARSMYPQAGVSPGRT